MKIWINKELFQWEKDRWIYIETLENEPEISYVQFYNQKSTYGPEVKLKDNKAKIPNYLLKDYFPIMAVACVGEEGSGKAVSRRKFRVIKRVKPENYTDDLDEGIEVIYDGGIEE